MNIDALNRAIDHYLGITLLIGVITELAAITVVIYQIYEWLF